MHGLAAFVMRGRLQATLLVAVSAMGSLLIPPALIVSGAGVAVVTLRQGGREGVLLALLASLAVAALALPILANGVAIAGGILLLFWLPICLLSLVLRTTVSLAWTLQAAAVLGGLAVLAFYLVLGDPSGWWLGVLNDIFKPLLSDAGLVTEEAALDEVLEFLAPLMPGLIVANLLAYLLLGLLLARWWQSLLFNPGGFRSEFHELRLGRQMAVATLVVFGIVLALRLPLVVNLALVLAIVYALQGIALVHGAIGRAGLSRNWLVGLYVLLIFALPQILLLLCVLGILDAWVDLRARIKPHSGPE